MSFNNLLTQQKSYIENKFLESQDYGSGWTLHSISLVHLLLVINPRNISPSKVEGRVMSDAKFGMRKWDVNQVHNNLILIEAEVDGSDFEDEEEKGANEYDVNDKFVNDESIDSDSDISFYLKQNSKRRNDVDEQQSGPSSKKSRLEARIDNYETFDAKSIVP